MYHMEHFIDRLLEVSRGTLNGQIIGCIMWNTSWPGYWMYHVGYLMARLLDVSHGTLHSQATGRITWDT